MRLKSRPTGSRPPESGDAAPPIGEVALQKGLAASALRYYEGAGLLGQVPRRGGRRVYPAEVRDRVALIQLARAAGFSIHEVATLLHGFPPQAKAGTRWRVLVKQKRAQVERGVAELTAMLSVLRRLERCDCPDLEACGAAARRRRSARDRGGG